MTGMSEEETKTHVTSAFELWRQRSQHVWTLDLTMLTGAGVTVTPPPNADTRAQVAVTALAQSAESPRAATVMGVLPQDHAQHRSGGGR